MGFCHDLNAPVCLLGTDPLAFVLVAVGLVLALSLHEFGHAAAATWQGDRLAKAQGRLTLNPVRHLDPLGTILIFLVGFGWARPVPFRPTALRSQRFGAALVALAGPGVNLLLALLGSFPLVASLEAGTEGTLVRFLLFFVPVNVLLAVFNLLPLPPLDGSRLLTIFLPPRHHRLLYFLDQYGMMILLGLMIFGGISFLTPIIDWILGILLGIAGA